MNNNQNIRFITFKSCDSDLIKQSLQLRVISRNKGGYITFKKYPMGWFDKMDDYAIHIAGFVGNEFVCSMRIVLLNSIAEHPYYNAFKDNKLNFILGEKCAYLSRACVKPNFWGRGYFKKMMSYSYDYCNLIGFTKFFGDADAKLTEVYCKMGWEKIGLFKASAIEWDLDLNGQSFIFFSHE